VNARGAKNNKTSRYKNWLGQGGSELNNQQDKKKDKTPAEGGKRMEKRCQATGRKSWIRKGLGKKSENGQPNRWVQVEEK